MPNIGIQGVITAVAVVLIAALIIYVTRIIYRSLSKTTYLITLPVDSTKVPAGLRFGIRHIRNGSGTEINQDHSFTTGPASNKLVAPIRAPRRTGFQYKCFAEVGDIGFESAREILSGLDLQDPSPDSERPSRVWFLVPNKPTVDNNDFRNNVQYPA